VKPKKGENFWWCWFDRLADYVSANSGAIGKKVRLKLKQIKFKSWLVCLRHELSF